MHKSNRWVDEWLEGQFIGEVNAGASMRALRRTYAEASVDARALRAVDKIIRSSATKSATWR